MARNAIVFGNGLGMALDSTHFSLSNALNAVWEDPNILDPAQKKLIDDCIPGVKPTDESDLDKLHLAAMACHFLSELGTNPLAWLTAEGAGIPAATLRFITKVAWRLFRSSCHLPEEFIDALVEHLKNSKSHVATLNYDNLLYQPLIDNSVLAGYNGCLVDGMLSTGFSPENLDRLGNNDFGYYLHLHGSPLFVDRDGTVIKQSQSSATEDPSRHLVLTHVRHKPSVIDDSEVLREYWKRMRHAMAEAENLILFGYSGLDDHLNELIRTARHKTRTIIVEWDGAGTKLERSEYWKCKIDKFDDLKRLPNILSFTDWDCSSLSTSAS